MNVLFVVKGCLICHEAKKKVLIMNQRLQARFKIQIVDIDAGDPRNARMARIFKSWNREEWIVPVLDVQSEIVAKNLDGYRKRIGGAIMIGGMLETSHYKTVLEGVTSEQTWR